jgi:transaldolase
LQRRYINGISVIGLTSNPTIFDKTIEAAAEFRGCAKRPNLFIKIPGAVEGIPAIEEAIFAGVPVNVTPLFSREQYIAAAREHVAHHAAKV